LSEVAVDLCIPYWGDPAQMRACVESVLSQDSDRWYLTVVDDAYHDPDIGNWMTGLNHPRVKYLRNEKNVGIVGNYRKLIALAQQDLMVLLGCDDILLPNYVSTILAAHEKYPSVAIIQPGTKVIDEHGRDDQTLPDWAKTKLVMPRNTQPKLLSGEALAASLLTGDWLYWPSIAFRRDRLAHVDFNADLKITHDLALVMDMVVAGEQLLLEPTLCFAYRRHTASASTGSLLDGRRFAEERKYFSIARQQVAAKGWKKAERAARWHLTSRANALWIILNTVFKGNFKPVPVLFKHVFNRLV
jgi:hypothetical protein